MRIPEVSHSFSLKKWPSMRRYQITLVFSIAAVAFVSLYFLAASQVIVAVVFIVLLAGVLIVDNRAQRGRSRDRAIINEQLAARQRAETELARRAAALEAVRKELEEFKKSAAEAGTAPDGFGKALIEDYQDRLEEDLVSVTTSPITVVTVAQAAPEEPVGLDCRDWIPVLRKKYLQEFINNGGATVKFVVPLEAADHQQVSQELARAATEEGYTFVAVDAAATRVHLVDQIFHAVAREIPWDDLAHAFLCKTLKDSSYLVPTSSAEFNLAKIADLNGLDLGQMRAIINNRLRENLYRDYEMIEDFRVAMLKLCQAQLDPQDLGVGTPEAIREWLRGDLQLISALRSASIFEKIGRHSGREMLASLSYWLRLTGKSGLVLNLDISRFMVDRRVGESDTSVYYSTAAVVDGYEVLRQFIDSTNELQYCLIVVTAPPTFLTDEARGVRKYDALYLRIWDEVYDRKRVNPMSALIRIAKQKTPAQQRVAAGVRS